jgi:hypothetical protein
MMNLQLGDVISVNKDGIIAHPGIFVGDRGRGFFEVVHNTPRKGGVVCESLETFAEGKTISVISHTPADLASAYVERGLSLVGRRYDLLSFNCEHFVSWVRSGSLESPQLTGGLAAILTLGLGLLYATRPNYDAKTKRYRTKAGKFSTFW